MGKFNFFGKQNNTRTYLRVGHRLRTEVLEQRTLLSVSGALDLTPPEDIASLASAALAEEFSRPVDVRIAVWTEERIGDLGAWVESQQWPGSLGGISPDEVDQLISQRLLQDPRGGYRTMLRVMVCGNLTEEEAVAELEGLDFVDFAKLESESFAKYTDALQESLDSLTLDHVPGKMYALPRVSPQRSLPWRLRIRALRLSENCTAVQSAGFSRSTRSKRSRAWTGYWP